MRNDDHAVVGMPVYLFVAFLVASVVITVFMLSVHGLFQESQTNQLHHELGKIVREAETMYEYADDGTVKTIEVDFPSSLRSIVFGALPNNTTGQLENQTLDEQTSNNYYYVLNDDSFQVFHSSARFSSNDTGKIAVLYPGTHTLILELRLVEGRTYVTIRT